MRNSTCAKLVCLTPVKLVQAFDYADRFRWRRVETGASSGSGPHNRKLEPLLSASILMPSLRILPLERFLIFIVSSTIGSIVSNSRPLFRHMLFFFLLSFQTLWMNIRSPHSCTDHEAQNALWEIVDQSLNMLGNSVYSRHPQCSLWNKRIWFSKSASLSWGHRILISILKILRLLDILLPFYPLH